MRQQLILAERGVRFQLSSPSGKHLLRSNKPLLVEDVIPSFVKSCEELIHLAESRFDHQKINLLDVEGQCTDFLQIEISFLKFLFLLLETLGMKKLIVDEFDSVDPRLEKCIRHIHKHPLSIRYSESEMAQIAGLSLTHFNRLFSKQFGLTPRAYMAQTRLQETIRLLHTNLSIKEVAYTMGFSSHPHFSKWFTKQQGVTPKHFRSTI